MLPALTNRGIEIFKMTTLASAVAYVELLQQGKLLASLNFNPIETYTVIAVVFFLCLLPLVQVDLCAGAAPRPVGRMTTAEAFATGAAGASAPLQRPAEALRRQRRAARHRPRRDAGRPHRHPRRLGLGQEHAAALPQLHGAAERRPVELVGQAIGRAAPGKADPAARYDEPS